MSSGCVLCSFCVRMCIQEAAQMYPADIHANKFRALESLVVYVVTYASNFTWCHSVNLPSVHIRGSSGSVQALRTIQIKQFSKSVSPEICAVGKSCPTSEVSPKNRNWENTSTSRCENTPSSNRSIQQSDWAHLACGKHIAFSQPGYLKFN